MRGLLLFCSSFVSTSGFGRGSNALIPRFPHQHRGKGSNTRATITQRCLSPFGLEDTTDVRHETIRNALSRFDQLDATASKFLNELDKFIEVRPSLIEGAGRGLFAKKKIRKGKIICFYPVSGMGVDFGETTTIIANNDENQRYFEKAKASDQNDDAAGHYLLYLLGSRPLMGSALDELFDGDPIFVDVNPNQEYKAGWASHYINDGAVVTSVGEAGILDYYQKTRSKKNCVLVPFGPCPLVATVATRKIARDEEILTTYGGSFWADALFPDFDLEVTEAIQEQAKETAKEIFVSAQSISQSYQIEARMLESVLSP